MTYPDYLRYFKTGPQGGSFALPCAATQAYGHSKLCPYENPIPGMRGRMPRRNVGFLAFWLFFFVPYSFATSNS